MNKLTKEIINDKIRYHNIVLIGDYTATNKQSEFLCMTCNTKWIAIVSSVYYNKTDTGGCPVCAEKSKYISENELNKRLSAKRVKVLQFSGKLHTLSTCQCLYCDNVWQSTLAIIFDNKHNCPKCAHINGGLARRTNINHILDILKNKSITLISNFTILQNKHNLLCNICNHKWTTSLKGLYQKDTGCPKCSIIKRENTMIEKYGVRNAMQDKTMFEKQQISSMWYHKYDIGNIYYQSNLEKYFLDEILFRRNKEWFKANIRNGPRLDYHFDNVNRKYYADFYIIDMNLVIEIKSGWTYDKDGRDENMRLKNQIKWATVIENGFNFKVFFGKEDIDIFLGTVL